MAENVPSTTQSASHEQTVTVPPGHNILAISLRDHSWVSISIGDEEIARNLTPAPSFGLAVPPGTYTVRSDGVIERVSWEILPPISSPLEQLQQGLPAVLPFSL